MFRDLLLVMTSGRRSSLLYGEGWRLWVHFWTESDVFHVKHFSHRCYVGRTGGLSPVHLSRLSASRWASFRWAFCQLNSVTSISRYSCTFWLPNCVSILPVYKPPWSTIGFFASWDSIVLEVQPVVEQLLSVHEGYSVVTVGHSLGGAVSLLAAVHLKENFREM